MKKQITALMCSLTAMPALAAPWYLISVTHDLTEAILLRADTIQVQENNGIFFQVGIVNDNPNVPYDFEFSIVQTHCNDSRYKIWGINQYKDGVLIKVFDPTPEYQVATFGSPMEEVIQSVCYQDRSRFAIKHLNNTIEAVAAGKKVLERLRQKEALKNRQ